MADTIKSTDPTVGQLLEYAKNKGIDPNTTDFGTLKSGYLSDGTNAGSTTKIDNTSGAATFYDPAKDSVAPFSDEIKNLDIAQQKAAGLTGASYDKPTGEYTLKAYDMNNGGAVKYVKPGEYVAGMSATPPTGGTGTGSGTGSNSGTGTGTTDTTGSGGTGGDTTPTSENDKAFEEYLKNLTPTAEETALNQKIADTTSATNTAITGAKQDPAELRFVTGQEQNIAEQGKNKIDTLQRQLAIETAKRQISTDVSKAKYERADAKAKAALDAKAKTDEYYRSLTEKGYTLVTNENQTKGLSTDELMTDPLTGKKFIKPSIAGSANIYTFKETDEKTGKNYVIGINKSTGAQLYKTDIGIISKVTGTGAAKQDFTLSSDAKSTLLGAGLDLTEIKNIQNNINNGYSVDEIITAGGSDEAKAKAIKSVFGKIAKNEFSDIDDQSLQSLTLTKYVDDNGDFDITKVPLNLTVELKNRGLTVEEPTNDEGGYFSNVWKALTGGK